LWSFDFEPNPEEKAKARKKSEDELLSIDYKATSQNQNPNLPPEKEAFFHYASGLNPHNPSNKVELVK